MGQNVHEGKQQISIPTSPACLTQSPALNPPFLAAAALRAPLETCPPTPVSPYQDLEKATVLQECRVFSDSNVVTNHPRRCGMLITKLLYILTQGETLSSSETTEVREESCEE